MIVAFVNILIIMRYTNLNKINGQVRSNKENLGCLQMPTHTSHTGKSLYISHTDNSPHRTCLPQVKLCRRLVISLVHQNNLASTWWTYLGILYYFITVSLQVLFSVRHRSWERHKGQGESQWLVFICIKNSDTETVDLEKTSLFIFLFSYFDNDFDLGTTCLHATTFGRG